ncbi:hypothetical protein NL676_011090 [Syzygium grande]|nr:hypothetical protein NL676_011090 [Syzygium grande]
MIHSSELNRDAVSYSCFPHGGVRGHPTRWPGPPSRIPTRPPEQMAAVNGVDCIQMGPLDLSASTGYLWDPGSKKFDPLDDLRKRGYHMVSGAVGVGPFCDATVEDMKRFRMGLEDRSGDGDGGRMDGKDADEKHWSE